MCTNSCITYTGPYDDLEACPRCGTSCYLPGTTDPCKCFATIPIGPVIQAFYGSPDVAENMHYLEKRLSMNIDYARCNNGQLDKYNDTLCGKDILDTWQSGSFTKSDVALQFSIEGTQLRPDQPSKAWVFIWVVHNLPPEIRYKKRFVVPASIIPRPNKPGDMDSFLFLSLFHVAALQRKGLRIYDTFLDAYIARSVPCIIFGTANSPGCAAMTGMVGHSGKSGCRLYCDMPG